MTITQDLLLLNNCIILCQQIGWTLKLVWLNPTALICARLIIGFGGAGTLLIAPLYSSEVASVEARGMLGTMLTFAFNIGVVVIYALGAYFSYFIVLTIMLTIPFLFFILMSRMPESPSYLVKTNQLKVGRPNIIILFSC